jgi:SAM-dependent methyltransferase
MIPYITEPLRLLNAGDRKIASFVRDNAVNRDEGTVRAFGEEWSRFSDFDEDDLATVGAEYFDLVGPGMIGSDSVVLDIGCGTGRWSRYIAGRVRHVEAVDPSDAVFTAARLTAACGNVRVTHAGFDDLPFPPHSFDFVFSLGVAHHVPDTPRAIQDAVRMLRPGGHLLLYLYYALDGRGWWYRMLFRVSGVFRRVISRLPKVPRFFVCDCLSLLLCLPLVLLSRAFRRVAPRGQMWRRLPLAYYTDKSFHILRNDTLDRFGTPLEKRFRREEIADLLRSAGLTDVVFSERPPYWHVVARR